QLRVANRLDVDGSCGLVDGGLDGVGVVGVDEPRLDPEAAERVVEEGEGAAVERVRSDDRAAGPGEVEDGEELGRLAARRRDRGDAALQVRDAPLEDVRSRVHDPRVNVAELAEPEEV